MNTPFLKRKSFKFAVISIAAVFSFIIILTAGSFAYAGLEEDSYKLLLSPRKEGGWHGQTSLSVLGK